MADLAAQAVLMIDLDFQGSLSSMSVAGNGWLPQNGWDSRVGGLISGDFSPADIVNTVPIAATANRNGAVSPVVSSIKYFRDEFIEHCKRGGCPFDRAASTIFGGSWRSAAR